MTEPDEQQENKRSAMYLAIGALAIILVAVIIVLVGV